MWESICLTIAATAGNNIGKVLQKKGTVILPPLSFKLKAPPFPSVIRAYAFNKPWVIGFLMDIFGALLMLRALSLAPEMMNAVDWVGITMAGIGTIGNRVTKYDERTARDFVLLNGWLRIYRRQRREQELMQSEVVEEIIYGLESGVLFGIASVISKMGFLFLEQGFSKLLTRGLKHGRAIVVSTCAAVASIVTGVLAGMFALGERLPKSPMARLWLLLGWLKPPIS
ncbi:hypothetical protein RJ639_044175 [Escallonia herrerae]|uniref:Uncharacterized protein n=1 Tax=Escallonia herrerae TaxID=1293975 RepID=A0AA89B293_9ASTE|nr:hypothetical protein RJ639_044175 [Escallonia herrerae]